MCTTSWNVMLTSWLFFEEVAWGWSRLGFFKKAFFFNCLTSWTVERWACVRGAKWRLRCCFVTPMLCGVAAIICNKRLMISAISKPQMAGSLKHFDTSKLREAFTKPTLYSANYFAHVFRSLPVCPKSVSYRYSRRGLIWPDLVAFDDTLKLLLGLWKVLRMEERHARILIRV